MMNESVIGDKNDAWLNQTLIFLIVSFIWGITNPFIKRGSQSSLSNSSATAGKTKGKIQQFLDDWIKLLSNWSYLVPLLGNLTGSLIYYSSLKDSDISLAVPLTNSLTFVIALATGYFLEIFIGMALIVSGVTCCIFSKTL